MWRAAGLAKNTAMQQWLAAFRDASTCGNASGFGGRRRVFLGRFSASAFAVIVFHGFPVAALFKPLAYPLNK